MNSHVVSVRVRRSINERTVILDVYPRCELLDDYLGQVFSLGELESPGFVPVNKMKNFPREALPKRLERQLERQLETAAVTWRAGEAYEVSMPDGPVVKLASTGPEGGVTDIQLILPGVSPRVHNINAARERKRSA